MTLPRLLLVDAGNTNVKFGICAHNGPIASYALPTANLSTADALGLAAVSLCRHADADPRDIDVLLVSSVVPRLDPLIARAGERYFSARARFAGRDLPVPLENRYARPEEVGADRLVTAHGARLALSSEKAVSIDFGTATTFDCVAEGAYLGGLICPGVLSSAGALAGTTAKLPQADLAVEGDELDIGTSTRASLNHGLVFGFAAMVEGLAARLRARLGSDTPVIATGGFAETIAAHTDAVDAVEPDLLFIGLRDLNSDRAGNQS